MNTRRMFGGIVVLACSAAVLLVAWRPKGEQPVENQKVLFMEAHTGLVGDRVMAEGSVVASRPVNVSPLPGFTGIVKQVFVDIGDHVSAGQVLAELDSSEQQTEVAQADASVAEANAKLRLSEVPYRSEEIEHAGLLVAEDRQRIEEARAKLDLLKAGSRNEEVLQAQAAVEDAQAKLKYAVADRDRNKELCDRDLVPKAELELSETQVIGARSQLTQAQNALKILQDGSRPEDIRAAQATVNEAKIAYARDLKQLQILKLGSRSEQIDMDRAAFDQARSKANQARMVLDRQYVRAPVAGTIMERNVNPGEIADSSSVRSTAGAQLNPGTRALFVIASNDGIEFMANVDQLYYRRTALGMPVTVSIESLPGQTFQGRISRLQPTITPLDGIFNSKTGKAVSPLSFPVWIKVASAKNLLVPGQSGYATFSSNTSGLVIPMAAINALTIGEGMAYVVQNGKVVSRRVQFDQASDGMVRVLSGVRSGEKVVVSDWSHLKDGLAVDASPASAKDLSSAAF